MNSLETHPVLQPIDLEKVMDIDSALALVGGYKRWNIGMYFLVAVAFSSPLCFHALSIVFTGWEPPHICVGSGSLKNETDFTKIDSHSLWLNMTERNQTSKCSLERPNPMTGNTTLEACNKWIYNDDGYYSIVEQWNLVCDKNYLSELSQTLYQVGALIGELFCFLVDKYGRKRMHIISHLCICVIGIINAFSVSYPMFAVTKAIIGFFVALNITSGIMLILEFFDGKRRTVPGVLLQNFWAFCYVILPGIAILIKKWVYLQLAISLVSPVFALLVMFIPESPSWLVSKGETKKADAILRKVAKWNNIKVDDNKILIQDVPKSSEQVINETNSDIPFKTAESFTDNPAGSLKDIDANFFSDSKVDASALSSFHPVLDNAKPKSKFSDLKDPVILKFVTISSLFWFATCLVFYGLILSTPKLEGNRFVNFVLLGAVEWPAVFIATYLALKVGRRLTTSVTLLIAGIVMAIVIFIPVHEDEHLTWVKLALVIISKGFISATFSIMVLYTKELFPTNLRATCCGICQVWGRIGSLLAPMAAYLIKTDYYWVPNILFGVISVIVSVLLLLLPETNNQAMPESIEDCHKLNSQKPICGSLKDSC